jgi:glucose/sorbosone dehydrogenase
MKRLALLALCFSLLGAGSARALTLESLGRFDHPTYVTSDPGNAGRLFVSEREGTIQLLVDGVAHQFADLSSKVECKGACQGERGLMSVAPAPDFDSSGHIFVDYINDETGTIHVDRLTASPGLETADLSTLEPVFSVEHSAQSNHNGGQLQFGPDGMLYVSTGDGGGGNDELHNSQDLESKLGKLLRVVPQPGSEPEIWSYGLRNPFRFSFDRATGDTLIGDVGQGAREEIDMARSPGPGLVGGQQANYGWNCREGFIAGPATDQGCAGSEASDFVEPVFDYPHEKEADVPGGGSRCAVIGGYVVRDAALGNLFGHYLYADLCSGAIRSLHLPSAGETVASDDCWTGLKVSGPVSFGEDAAARVYVVTEGGEVFRFAGLPPTGCPAPAPPGGGAGGEGTGDGGGSSGAGGGPAKGGGEAPLRLRRTALTLAADRSPVRRGARVRLSLHLAPCAGREGTVVQLRRGGRRDGATKLGKGCEATFVRRIRHLSTFTASVAAGDGFAAAAAPKLIVAVLPTRSP